METPLEQKIATLKTRLHLTTARRGGSGPAIWPNSISLHNCILVPSAAMDLKPSHAPAFTIVPGTSPAPVFQKPITTRKWSTKMIWTWHGAITPSRLLVLPADMSITITRPPCPTREHRDHYLLRSDSPPPRLNGTIHTTAPKANK